VLSLLLVLVLVLGLAPVTVLATPEEVVTAPSVYSSAPIEVGEVGHVFTGTPEDTEVSIIAPTPPEGRRFTRWITNRDDTLVWADGTSNMCVEATFIMPPHLPGNVAHTGRHGLWIRAIFDQIPDEDSILFNTVYYLSEVIGVRWRGSPNEERAAHWVADQFAALGLESEVYTKMMGNYNTAANMWLYELPTQTWVPTGMVVFNENGNHFGDFIGNAMPNNATFNENFNPTGQLVDFGTWPGGLTVPAGLTGDVVAAIRFDGTPSIALATAALAAISTESPNIDITGLLFTRSTGTLAQIHGPVNGLAALPTPGIPGVPSIALNLFNFERALTHADDFTGLVWHTYYRSFSAMGVLPATTDDPDLLIVFVAHLDSVRSAAGVDDNASGVASVIALAAEFAEQDRGNVEMWFVAAGGEEGNGMSGAVEAAQRVVRAGHRDIAIVFNQDMISSPGTHSAFGHVSLFGEQLDTLGIDIWPTGLAGGLPQHTYGWPCPITGDGAYFAVNPFNLPAHLIITHATEAGWQPLTPIAQDPRNIQNIRMYREGFTDHQEFGRRGIENASGIICEDAGNGLGLEYHNARDNLWENYSYDRHNLVFNIFRNAAQTALDNQVTKRALLAIDQYEELVKLYNATQLFGFLEEVRGHIGGVDLIFTPENYIFCIAAAIGSDITTHGWTNLTAAQENAGVAAEFLPVDYRDPFTDEVVDIFWGFGTGIADYRNAPRNARYNQFSTTLRAEFIELPTLTLVAFNNGTCDEVPSMAGNIRIWPQLNGVGAPIPRSAVITAYDQDNNDASQFLTKNRLWDNDIGWRDYYINFDVNKDAPWQYIDFTVAIFGRTVTVRLINNLYTPVTDIFGVRYFNNGNSDNASLAQMGVIRIWMQLNGANALVPHAELGVEATFPNGQDAMAFVRVNRIWNDPGNVNLIDVDKDNGSWQYINLTLTLFGQTVNVLLINDLYVPFTDVFGVNYFNNGNSNNQSLANLGVIRIWTQLNGINALVPYANLGVTATFPNGQNAMEFVRVNRIWNDLDNVNMIDVRKDSGSWEHINLTLTLFGQTVYVLLVNDLYL